MGISCESCGANNLPEYSFCQECGAPFPNMNALGTSPPPQGSSPSLGKVQHLPDEPSTSFQSERKVSHKGRNIKAVIFALVVVTLLVAWVIHSQQTSNSTQGSKPAPQCTICPDGNCSYANPPECYSTQTIEQFDSTLTVGSYSFQTVQFSPPDAGWSLLPELNAFFPSGAGVYLYVMNQTEYGYWPGDSSNPTYWCASGWVQSGSSGGIYEPQLGECHPFTYTGQAWYIVVYNPSTSTEATVTWSHVYLEWCAYLSCS